MIEVIYEKSVYIARMLALGLLICLISTIAGVTSAWLVANKYGPRDTPVVSETVNNDREAALRSELQALQAKYQRDRADSKKVIANLKAQIQTLTAQIGDDDLQLEVLQRAAKASATLPPMSDRELETKTKHLLGVSGKVGSR